MRFERSSARSTASDLVIEAQSLGQNQVSTEWKDGFFSRGVVRLRNLEQAPSGDLEARPHYCYTQIVDENGDRLFDVTFPNSYHISSDDLVCMYTFRRSGGERKEILATKRKLFWLERVGGFKCIAHEIRRSPGPSDLANILVTATKSGGGYTASVTTDSYGNYSFPNCPAGTYTLTFVREPDINTTKTVVVT